MLLFLLVARLVAVSACDLNGTWCCETTVVRQVGEAIWTNASYGMGIGSLLGFNLSVQFTNQPAGSPLNATLDTDCDIIHWENGAVWTREVVPSPAPAWASTLSILEVNALTYTSPNGTGTGSGSGNWSSLTEKVTYWAELGVTGVCPNLRPVL